MTLEERKKWINEYKKYPTGNISDAMDNLGIRRGAILGVHALDKNQPKAGGFALTIQQMRRGASYDGKNLALHSQVIDNKTQEGDLLVIDMGGMLDVSTGGALLALRAQHRGVVGELTNGCLRDVDEIASMGFPVYFAGGVPVKSALDVETVGINVPVMMGGVKICPGDFILMDSSGVICVPAEHLEEVLKEAEKIHRKEAEMEALIRQGYSVSEARKVQ